MSDIFLSPDNFGKPLLPEGEGEGEGEGI